jgi:hypothetical protein
MPTDASVLPDILPVERQENSQNHGSVQPAESCKFIIILEMPPMLPPIVGG